MSTRYFLWVLFISVLPMTPVSAQNNNFQDRKAIILNTCPHVELSQFTFGNRYADRRDRFEQHMTWKNTSDQSLVAFEIVILKYDPYDQRVIGNRWSVAGKNSADWRPLEPGESSSDGTIGYGTEDVFTAIAYVRAARLADGKVWRANDADVVNKLKSVAPGIRDFGSIKPDAKRKEE